MSKLESIRDIVMRLSGKRKEPELPPHDNPPLCGCGEPMRSVCSYGLDVNHDIVHFVGWSCVRPGCSGNCAERMAKQADEWLDRMDEARKLTGIDREMLREMGIEA